MREVGRGRREETNSMIERMEVQFNGQRDLAIDTESEALLVWPEGQPFHSYDLDPVASAYFLDSVDIAGSGTFETWRTVQASSHNMDYSLAAKERWFLSRVRERRHVAYVDTGPDREEQFVRGWMDRVDPSLRERFVIDLEYAIERLKLIFAGSQGLIWLESFNYDLNARPIDVMRVRGPAEVIAAMDGAEYSVL